MRTNGTTYALAAGACLLWAQLANAYQIPNVDGDPGDWILSPPIAPTLPLNINTGHLVRGPGLIGEFTWRDETGDRRFFPSPWVDIETFHVTADTTNIYFRITMVDLDSTPQIQIAIDRSNLDGAGNLAFLQNSDTLVAPAAAWEYLVVTTFISGNPGPLVYDPGQLDVNDGSAKQGIAPAPRTMEISVPWTMIGGVPLEPLHFTVISLEADSADLAIDIPGESDAHDAVTNYGHPSLVPENTLTETIDLTVDYHFAVWFHLNVRNEPASPLLISEINPAPSASTDGEWIELFNASPIELDLGGFRLGDAETVGEPSEGMFFFPAGANVLPGFAQVIASEADRYFATHGRNPNYELGSVDALVPDMSADSLWASGGLDLVDAGDEVLLLDSFATIIDVLTWDGGAYPDTVPAAAVPTGESLARTEAHADTNVCSADFALLASPTPGAAEAPCTDPAGGFLAEGFPCNNGDPCVPGACDAGGICQDGAAISCADDGDDCTDDVCDSIYVLGCYPPSTLGAACADTTPEDCLAARCDGAGGCDQSAELAGASYVCRPSVAPCDAPDRCNGADSTCPADDKRTTECRSSRGDCDPAELCDGVGDTCPTDQYVTSGACDDDDLCTVGTQCNASGLCTGGTDICPDAGPLEDASGGEDAAIEDANAEDAAAPEDAAVLEGGSIGDAGALRDAAASSDAGSSPDATIGSDAATGADSQAGQDASLQADAAPGRDASASSDAGASPDSAGAVDGGGGVEAGASGDGASAGQPPDEGASSSVEEGCECRAAPAAAPAYSAPLMLIAAALWRRLRRTRSQRSAPSSR